MTKVLAADKHKRCLLMVRTLLNTEHTYRSISLAVGCSVSLLTTGKLTDTDAVKLSNLYESDILGEVDIEARKRQIISLVDEKDLVNKAGTKDKIKFVRLNTNRKTYAITDATHYPGDFISADTEILKGLKFAFGVWDKI